MHRDPSGPRLRLIKPMALDSALWYPLLFAAVTLPMMTLSRAENGAISGGVSFVYAAIVYLSMSLLSLITLRHRRVFRALLHRDDFMLCCLVISILMQVLISQSFSIFVQMCVLVAAFFSIRATGYSARMLYGLFLSSVALFLFIALAYLLLGPPNGRWLGGMHPNVFGTSCVALVALSLFGSKRWIDIAYCIAVAAALGVSSRYAMTTSTLIYLMFWMFNWRHISSARAMVFCLIIAIGIFSLVFLPSGGFIADALALNDETRGLSSGVSGRDGHWAYFMPQFLERPILGYGFRNRGSYVGAHNGFLDLFLQLGLLGAISFFSFLALRLRQLVLEFINTPRLAVRGRLLTILIALMFGAQLQPQFISFGDPFGILALLCLFASEGMETRWLQSRAKPSFKSPKE
jgi:O-antigen ligase